MREKKKNIIEYDLKKRMFLDSLNVLYPIILSKGKNIKKESFSFMIYSDTITAILDFKKTNELKYPLGFFLTFSLGEEYSNLVNNKNRLNETLINLRNENLWDSKEISYEMALFFSYTFMNELFKDIAIDTHLLSQDSNPRERFLNIRKEILNL